MWERIMHVSHCQISQGEERVTLMRLKSTLTSALKRIWNAFCAQKICENETSVCSLNLSLWLKKSNLCKIEPCSSTLLSFDHFHTCCFQSLCSWKGSGGFLFFIFEGEALMFFWLEARGCVCSYLKGLHRATSKPNVTWFDSPWLGVAV